MKRQPINHGTYGGYQAHRKRGEETCVPCREANRRYQRDLRKRPDIQQRESVRSSARSRAVWRLAGEYPERFRELYLEEVQA